MYIPCETLVSYLVKNNREVQVVKILLFMGSPRIGGNSDILSQALITGARNAGAKTERLPIAHMHISPCLECGGCDKTGECIIDDEMRTVYRKIEASDVIVVASPVFFYNITASTQAVIERSQACWIGKYVLKRGKFGGKTRKGVLLCQGATKGRLLFDGILRTIRYFFDAIDTDFKGALLYRGIEAKGAIRQHPDAINEAETLGKLLATGATLESYKPLKNK